MHFLSSLLLEFLHRTFIHQDNSFQMLTGSAVRVMPELELVFDHKLCNHSKYTCKAILSIFTTVSGCESCIYSGYYLCLWIQVHNISYASLLPLVAAILQSNL